MAGKKRVAIYCRLAREDSVTMECQRNYLRRWAVKGGYEVVDEIAEIGSGVQLDRPGLTKAMQAVQEKRIDALVVKDLDRLTRKTLDAFQIMEKLKEQGVDLICVDGGPAIDKDAIHFWK